MQRREREPGKGKQKHATAGRPPRWLSSNGYFFIIILGTVFNQRERQATSFMQSPGVTAIWHHDQKQAMSSLAFLIALFSGIINGNIFFCKMTRLSDKNFLHFVVYT
jgi:hypothetical protein